MHFFLCYTPLSSNRTRLQAHKVTVMCHILTWPWFILQHLLVLIIKMTCLFWPDLYIPATSSHILTWPIFAAIVTSINLTYICSPHIYWPDLYLERPSYLLTWLIFNNHSLTPVDLTHISINPLTYWPDLYFQLPSTSGTCRLATSRLTPTTSSPSRASQTRTQCYRWIQTQPSIGYSQIVKI